MTQSNQFTHGKLLGQYLTRFQRQLLQKHLDTELTPEYRQRIEIMILADEGKTQTQICKALGCSPLTARHWIFMAKSGQAHNWQEQPIGRPKIVNAEYLARLKELVSKSPKEFGYSFPRWTGQWLGKHLAKEFNIDVSARHINRLIREIEVAAQTAEAEDRHFRAVGAQHHLVITDLHDRDPGRSEEVSLRSPTSREGGLDFHLYADGAGP
jgi:transposase